MAEQFSSPRQAQEGPVKTKKYIHDLGVSLIEKPAEDPSAQAGKPKRRREDEVTPANIALERSPKRTRTVWRTLSDARVDYWRENGTWPNPEQEETMDRFQEPIKPALAKKKSSNSLRRKRSEASINAETILTPSSSDQAPRELKSATYRYLRYESRLSERGSFMAKYKNISVESRELCRKLLESPQTPPKHTLFDDDLFEETLELIKGRNETRIIRDIAQLIVPPAELLAMRGSKHLKILRETTNAGWNNAIPFYGPRPQPDYGLGFKRQAFTKEQLQKLQPFIGNDMEECSYFAATDDMYFPFLTSEVKCGASALDIADRQNAHSQTVLSRGLFELFRLVGRAKELDNTISGFSYSHSDVDVRIWAHLIVTNGDDVKFYREPIAKFDIEKTIQADNRWIAWTVTMNILDLWVADHFRLICSAVDMLPAKLDFDVSELSDSDRTHPEPVSSQSGIPQQAKDCSTAGPRAVPDGSPDIQQMTPTTTIQSKSSNSKKKKTK
ncbi:hypothetical protein EJ05DRAFT_23383 [Pseudovirgaria hyperparasitica]|uniref:DUF7924 domain-containing protein n=1 Tax=Pseudovirgaria hyperparasitica TaxID=470096 RepID=A0A6A6WLE8_9PEZI|nr:uncharacterized protein EJ05DRAFT_23383 [Pseudovirgaria hyperparasitica]KAF2763011.1 hypothetical protein EJ05DRAFT_23383 [Pseudovirgaria hyperparasitica]